MNFWFGLNLNNFPESSDKGLFQAVDARVTDPMSTGLIAAQMARKRGRRTPFYRPAMDHLKKLVLGLGVNSV